MPLMTLIKHPRTPIPKIFFANDKKLSYICI